MTGRLSDSDELTNNPPPQDNRGYLDSFENFDLTPRNQFESWIEEKGQNCETGPIIDYGVCNDNYLAEYDRAAKYTRLFLQKDSATKIPPNSALVWPGERPALFQTHLNHAMICTVAAVILAA